MPALDSTLPALRSSPWQVVRHSQLPGAWLSVTSGKGALPRQAGLLHLVQTLLVLPPLGGHGFGAGKEGSHSRVLSSLQGREGSPAAQDPCARPTLGKFPICEPDQRSSLTLSSGAQRPCRLPPAQRRSPLAPDPPASSKLQRRARGVEAPRRRLSSPQPRSPKNAARGFWGKSQGEVLTERDFPPKPFPSVAILTPAASLWFCAFRRKGVLPSCPQPSRSLQCPGEGSRCLSTKPTALSVALGHHPLPDPI